MVFVHRCGQVERHLVVLGCPVNRFLETTTVYELAELHRPGRRRPGGVVIQKTGQKSTVALPVPSVQKPLLLESGKWFKLACIFGYETGQNFCEHGRVRLFDEGDQVSRMAGGRAGEFALGVGRLAGSDHEPVRMGSARS